MSRHYCPRCHYSISVKIGTTSSGRQRYRCEKCHKTWTNKPRPDRFYDLVWHDYLWDNLTSTMLARKYHVCKRTIDTIVENYEVPSIIPPNNYPATVVCMDVTYVGRKYGFLSVLDAHKGVCLYCAITRGYETIYDYEKAVLALHEHNIRPKAAVVDGKLGVIRMLERYGIKVQMCQFHMLRIATCYLTRKPVLTPNIALRNIVLSLSHTKQATFERAFYLWKFQHANWLAERSYNENGRLEYTHRKTRTLTKGMTVLLPYLFTFEQYPEFNIPKTNNLIEGVHSALKNKLNIHRGATKSLKTKIVFNFLSGRMGV